jgi:hypothetical protein
MSAKINNNMYYIDEKGNLCYEMCNMISIIDGFDLDGDFHLILQPPKNNGNKS